MLPVLFAAFVASQGQPATSLRFVAHTTDPTPVTGRLAGLAPDGSVALTDPAATIPAGRLVSLRREDRPLPTWPREPMLVLANGDRVRGSVVGGDTSAVRFAAAGRPGADPWSVPLSAVAAVWVTPPPADLPTDPAAYPWADGPRRKDAVLLRNGDVLRGTVEGFADDPPAARVKATGDPAAIAVPLARVAAVAFDPALARPRRPKGPYYRLVAADGSRVTLTTAVATAAGLTGKTAFGAAVELPTAAVVALDVLQGKAVYLSDMKPKRSAVEGYNGVAWLWAADRTVKSRPLRLAGPRGEETFDKGLGTHPRTTLAYDLGGKYRRFEATVGLDPTTGRRGAADVRILVDGKPAEVPGLAPLTGGASRPLAVDVTGAKELTLVVDYGPGGDVQDDVTWADARLVE